MSTTELRRQIKKNVDSLPPDHLASVADFVAFVGRQRIAQGSETDPRIDRLRDRIRQADAEEAAGKLIPLEKLRRKR